jgi:hypothetical protein
MMLWNQGASPMEDCTIFVYTLADIDGAPLHNREPIVENGTALLSPCLTYNEPLKISEC